MCIKPPCLSYTKQTLTHMLPWDYAVSQHSLAVSSLWDKGEEDEQLWVSVVQDKHRLGTLTRGRQQT